MKKIFGLNIQAGLSGKRSVGRDGGRGEERLWLLDLVGLVWMLLILSFVFWLGGGLFLKV